MSQYFPKSYELFGGDINVKVVLSNYATKSDITSIPGRRRLFGPPPTSIRHNLFFFLVMAMKLEFSIASQLLIRKILRKQF